MNKEDYRIKITIPDGSPKRQMQQVQDMKKVMQVFADVAGEELDTKPFDDAIAKLKTVKPKDSSLRRKK